MKKKVIAELLPNKEDYTLNKAAAASIWVKDFNKKHSVDSYLKVWNTLYDISSYQESGPDLNNFEGGFNGKVGSIDYYPTLLDQNDIYNLSLNTPKLDRSSIGIVPPYFAQTWWLQKS